MLGNSKYLWIIVSLLGLDLLAQERPIFNEAMRPMEWKELAYPLVAKLKRIEGTVVVWTKIDGEGRVLASRAISGPKDLIPEVLANSRKWRFHPNESMAAVIVYRFRIRGLCELPCVSQFLFEPPNFATVTIGTAVVDHSGN